MKRKAEITFLFSLVFIITMCCSAATVSAAPEDYINGFIDGISSAIDSTATPAFFIDFLFIVVYLHFVCFLMVVRVGINMAGDPHDYRTAILNY